MCDEDIGFQEDIDDSSEEIGDIDSRLIDYFLDAMESEALSISTALLFVGFLPYP